MAFLLQGQSSSPANPVLDLYTSFNNFLSDIASLEFQIFDITTPSKYAEFSTGNPNLVQIFPVTPGTRFTLDTVNLTSSLTPGNKLGTGHYYAPFTASPTADVGNYVVVWYYKRLLSSVEKRFQEEFSILPVSTPPVGTTLVDFLKLFMQDIIAKNQLIDALEYTPQQYDLSIQLALFRYNATTVVTNYTISNFPSEITYLVYLGAVGHLLRSTSIEQLRNQMTYTDGNIHVGLTDKHQLYVSIGNQHIQEFDTMTRAVKNQFNNESAWGEVFSPLLAPFGGWGTDGSGWGSA